jgi:PRC-barrel domain
MPITENDLSGVYAGDVLSASGEKIGGVGQIYLDDQTGEPTFVTANTGLFGMSQSFVPLRGARVENGNVVVDFDKTTVKDAPRIDDDGSLSPAEEDQLYAYYGMSASNVDAADYGTADQTPEPGYARTGADDRPDLGDRRMGDRNDQVETHDSRSGDRTDDGRTDQVLGDQPTHSADRDDRPGDADAGIDPRQGTDFGGQADDNGTTPDAPPADQDRDRLGRDGDGDAAGPPSEPPASGGGRLRKWVMTEYEPVKSEEVYVEGQGQPGERSTR